MLDSNFKKPYLMLLNIKKPQPEHAKIKTILDTISDGTSKAAYFDKHGGAFLFMSNLNAGKIHGRFDGVLLNEDFYLIIELGQDWATFGQGIAASWLRNHLR
jgi:hypothetical protein